MYGEDSIANDLLSGSLVVIEGYGLGTWQKKHPGSTLPTWAAFLGGIILFGARHYMQHPAAQAISEGLGYGGLLFGGLALAANTETLGKIPAGPLVINHSPSASAARRVMPAGVRPIAGRPSVMTPFRRPMTSFANM